MTGGVRGVFRHALVFGTAPVLQKLVSALLLPYFTHHVSTEQYGLRDLLVLSTGAFTVLFAFEYRVGFLRRFVALQSDAERSELLSASLALKLGLALLASASFLLAWPLIVRLFPEADAAVGPLFLGVLAASVFLDLLNMVLIATVQAQLWSGRMVTLNLTQFAVGVAMNVWFVAGMELGALGLFLGGICGSLTGTCGTLWLTRRLFVARPTLTTIARHAKPILKYTLPLWIGALGYFVQRRVDWFVVTRQLGLSTQGVYGMAWKLSNLLLVFLLVPFQQSFDVWRFKFYEERGDPRPVAEVFRLFLLTVGAAALGLATFGIDVFTWLSDDDYAGAAAYLPLLNAALLLQCASTVVASAFYVTGRTRPWVALFLMAAALGTVATWGLVKRFGVDGAPVAAVLSTGFLYAGGALLGRGIWPVPYRHGVAIGAIALVSALSMAHRWLVPEGLLAALGLDAGLMLVYVLAALLLGWVHPDELALARRSWTTLLASVARRERGDKR